MRKEGRRGTICFPTLLFLGRWNEEDVPWVSGKREEEDMGEDKGAWHVSVELVSFSSLTLIFKVSPRSFIHEIKTHHQSLTHTRGKAGEEVGTTPFIPLGKIGKCTIPPPALISS